jgi:hypothetical protein
VVEAPIPQAVTIQGSLIVVISGFHSSLPESNDSAFRKNLVCNRLGLLLLPAEGVHARNGCAVTPGRLGPSHYLRRVGVTSRQLTSTRGIEGLIF